MPFTPPTTDRITLTSRVCYVSSGLECAECVYYVVEQDHETCTGLPDYALHRSGTSQKKALWKILTTTWSGFMMSSLAFTGLLSLVKPVSKNVLGGFMENIKKNVLGYFKRYLLAVL